MVIHSNIKDGMSAKFDPPVEVDWMLFPPFECANWIAMAQIQGDNNKPWNIYANFDGDCDYALADSIEYGMAYILSEEQQ